MSKETSQESDQEFSLHKLIDGDNSAFVENMVNLFIKTAKEFISDMSLALNKEDLVQINELAHRIKPSLYIMQMNGIMPHIKDIENSFTLDDELRNKIHYTIMKLENVIVQMSNLYNKEV